MTEPFTVDPSTDDQTLVREIVDFYHRILQNHDGAQAYLAKRGINHPEAIDRFQIGFADRALALTLPAKRLKTGVQIRTRLEQVGILRNSGHGQFNGSVVFPVFDANDNVTEIHGRKINRKLRRGTPKHTYLLRNGSANRAPRGVWNASALKDADQVILCHSIIEALTWWCAGHHNVTAAHGQDGFTGEHVAAFQQHNIRQVLIAYGNTIQANAAAAAVAQQLDAAGIASARIKYPIGQDANKTATHGKSPSEVLGKLLGDASSVGDQRGVGFQPARGGSQFSRPDEHCKTENHAPRENGTVPLPAHEPEPPRRGLSQFSRPEEQCKTETHAPRENGTVPLGHQGNAPVPKPTNGTPGDSAADPHPKITDHEVVLTFDDRRYRIRGLAKNTSYGQLKVNIMATRDGLLHVDTLDLYVARPRATFIKQAAAELLVDEQTTKRDMGRLLQQLEPLQADHIRQLQAKQEEPAYQMTESEQQAARRLLESPNLVERIGSDFAACGVVGEQTNLLAGYLAATSRKHKDPLAVVIQSSSSAGKSSLMDAVLSFIPPEDKVQYSAVTGQSLFYMGDGQLKHKVLAIAEEGGVQQAAYALKLLQSDGQLTKVTTGRDGATGRIGTQQYRVEGPTALLMTTTQIDVDEELINRCVLLTVNEEREQTRAIHRQQRQAETLPGQLARDARDRIRILHHNAQRLLRPMRVVNPYAAQLTYLDNRTATRREHQKFLALIRTIALLHQYQRRIKRLNASTAPSPPPAQRNSGGEGGVRGQEYIEATLEDIALATRLAHEVLGRSIDDLPPQTRRLLRLIDAMACEACARLKVARGEYRFTRREVREWTGWGNTQLKVHLHRLEDLEYLIVHTGGGRGRRIEYELALDTRAADGQSRLTGLKDVDQLEVPPKPAENCRYDTKKSGQNGQKSGQNPRKSPPSRVQVGHKSAPEKQHNTSPTNG